MDDNLTKLFKAKYKGFDDYITINKGLIIKGLFTILVPKDVTEIFIHFENSDDEIISKLEAGDVVPITFSLRCEVKMADGNGNFESKFIRANKAGGTLEKIEKTYKFVIQLITFNTIY